MRDSRVLVGPSLGEDAAIIRDDGKVLVIHSDPITGTIRDVGRLAVHVSVNDVVSKGADPKWITLVLLLDPGVSRRAIGKIALQAHHAAVEVGASIVGGHTEITPAVERPVLISTVVGEAGADRFLTSGGAHPGDRIIMTKTAALEGTAILAHEFPHLGDELGEKVVRRATNLLKKISIYPEAKVAREAPGVTAMHDVTEGGVLCAVQEVASASGCGFVVYSSRVPVAQETRRVCAKLRLDPLRTIGSGSLIITIKKARSGELIRRLSAAGIPVAEIGGMLEQGQWLISGGHRHKIRGFVREEIWKVLDN